MTRQPSCGVTRAVVLLGMALPLLFATGCPGSKNKTATGTARVVVRPLISDATIESMTVTVTGAGFSPIVADLSLSDVQWTGRLDNIPVGSDRTFDAIAYDGSGHALYTASAVASVLGGAATVVSISLDNRPPETYQNAFPVIDSGSWPEEVTPGSVSLVSVTAHDPNPSYLLSYGWTATCGTFDDASSSSPHWTAPAVLENCQNADGSVSIPAALRPYMGGAETITASST